MSKRRRQSYEGGWLDARHERLLLRWQWQGTNPSRGTGLTDTTANRRRLEPLRQLVGRAAAANEDPTPVFDKHFPTHACADVMVPTPAAVPPAHEGPTVDEYTGLPPIA